MAHFRGVIRGQRGEASRLGSKTSSLVVTAQAWGGQVVTRLWHDVRKDGTRRDMVRVYVEANDATYGDAGKEVTLYYGPLDSLRNGNVDGQTRAKLDSDGNYL